MTQTLDQAVKTGGAQPGTVANLGMGITASDITAFGYTFNIMSVFVLMMLASLVFLLVKAQRNRRLDWVDMITKDGRVISLTKILQLIGGIVGTWIVLTLTMAGQMTWEILGIYLTYVASIEGFSKFMQAKYGPIQSQGGGYNYDGYRPSRPGRGGPTVNVGVQYNNVPRRPGPPKFGGRGGTEPTGGSDPSFSGGAKTPDIE